MSSPMRKPLTTSESGIKRKPRPENALLDKAHIKARAEGGEYKPHNLRLLDHVEHMKEHGILRIRTEPIQQLYDLIEDREKMMQLIFGISNQKLAVERMHGSDVTIALFQRQVEALEPELKSRTKAIEQWVKKAKAGDPFIQAALAVSNLKELTVAYWITFFEPAAADHPSSYWQYIGMGGPSKERYTDGEKSGGCKKLRTALWRMADSMMKNRKCPYRKVYDDTKARLEKSEQITWTRTTKGWKQMAWKDVSDGHRHGAALRAIIKHVTADGWFVQRTLLGLSTNDLYVKEHLGHASALIDPKARGWKF